MGTHEIELGLLALTGFEFIITDRIYPQIEQSYYSSLIDGGLRFNHIICTE